MIKNHIQGFCLYTASLDVEKLKLTHMPTRKRLQSLLLKEFDFNVRKMKTNYTLQKFH